MFPATAPLLAETKQSFPAGLYLSEVVAGAVLMVTTAVALSLIVAVGFRWDWEFDTAWAIAEPVVCAAWWRCWPAGTRGHGTRSRIRRR